MIENHENPANFIINSLPILGLVVCALLGLVTLVFKRKTSETSQDFLGLEHVPGPKPFPIKWIGNTLQLLPISDAINTALVWANMYPEFLKVTALNATFVALYSGPAIQQLFKSTEFGHNVKSTEIYDLMKPFITNGLLVSKGKFWQTQRKTMMKTQSFQAMKSYIGMLNKHSRNFVKSLESLFDDGKPHEINENINVLFLKAICEMITGNDNQRESDLDQYHHNFQIWKESIVARILHPWLIPNFLWNFHPLSRKTNKAVAYMSDFARMNIRNYKNKSGQTCRDAHDHAGVSGLGKVKSMLEELIDAGVDEDQIVDEVNTMLFGGHETGATAIHFFCLCIALHPEIQEECQKEIDELFGNPECVQDQNITYEAAQGKLKYLERCIQETLRLFPPVFILMRKLESSLKLDVNGNKYLIPAGCNIAITPLAVQRCSVYYPDPLKFDPDRFLPEEVAKRHPFSYIPFSGGPRNCLGLKFAMLEMKVVAAHLLRNFTITTDEKMHEVTLMPYTTLTPERNYVFTFKKR